MIMNQNLEILSQIPTKYKKLRNHLLIIMGIMILGLSLSIMFGYFAMIYALFVYVLMLILLFVFNNISIHLICITIDFIVICIYSCFEKFDDIFGNLGIYLLIYTVYHILLIRGNLINNILKTVYGYPSFNILLISAEMQKKEEIISQSIETALENRLLASEVKSLKRKPTHKILRVFNCVFAVMSIASLLLINYSLILESKIAGAENFTSATEGKNVYIKGEITGNVIRAAWSEITGEYWIFIHGHYVYVIANEKATVGLNALCDEDLSNDKPVEFVGKYVTYSQDANDAVLYKKTDDSDVIIDEKYMIKILSNNDYVVLNKIGYGILIAVFAYFILVYFVNLLFKYK
ncbi:MAG: hypothetical protein LBL93_02230 [Ruminococcus sp.]|jgi:hypothetical protein|nr:hypothetical protein [Ruminococcus sp.]